MVKIKQVNVAANYAWSPAENHPVYIAAGTAAQQLDATFSSNAKLELYAVDMADESYTVKCAGTIETENRFQKVVWGSNYTDGAHTSGLIVCGTDKGNIEIYNPEKILENEADCVLTTSKHTGPVRSLDFNNFQKNLFASGANDSEIFIWDLKNPTNPMTPGAKTQPTSAVGALAWNKQVQHILASTSSLTSGPCCVVWDLRKNEPIIKVQDPSGRMQCSDVTWHPDVATQLVLSSEDDHLPVVQLWDLRFATSPMKVLEKHSKGVLSVSWCKQDADLLLTCGKDNQVYCWNPNSSPPEILCELETGAQWCFDVQWCPRNPNVVSTGSFDGVIAIHSIMGGCAPVDSANQNQAQRNKITDAFGSDAFAGEAPNQQQQQPKAKSVPLKKPPKWMRRPCAASFSFGGKLVSFGNNPPAENQHQQPNHRVVKISQVVTEEKLLERSAELRRALADDAQCTDYCRKKLADAQNEFEEDFWSFLKVNFESEPRKEFLQLLGYNKVDLKAKVSFYLEYQLWKGNLNSQLWQLKLKSQLWQGNLNSQLWQGNFPQNNPTVPQNKKLTIFPPLPAMIFGLKGSLYIDSMISQALLIGDYEAAVDLCLHSNRMADAIVVAMAGGPELMEKTQKRYFEANESKISRLLSAVVMKNWGDVVKSCDLENWKEALASLLTYASPDELITLCDELGARLEKHPDLKSNACLCYICSGNIEQLVRSWNNVKPENNSNDIQDLIEKMMVLHRVVEQRSGGRSAASMGETASEKLSEYAHMLAAQGQLNAAMEMLPASSDKISIQILRDRLFHSQGDDVAGYQPPIYSTGLYNNQQNQQRGYQPTPATQPVRSQYNQQVTSPFIAFKPPRNQMYQPAQQRPAATPNRPQDVNPYARPNQAPTYSGKGFLNQVGFISILGTFMLPPLLTLSSKMSEWTPQAPTSMFTPQPVSMSTPQVPGLMPVSESTDRSITTPEICMWLSFLCCHKNFSFLIMPQSQAPSYQPYMAPVSAPQAVPQPMGNPPGPPSNGYTPDAERKHSSGGWNDPPALDPNRIPKKKKVPQPTTTINRPDGYKQPSPQPIDTSQLNMMTPAAPAPTPMGQMMQPGSSPMMQPGTSPIMPGVYPSSAPMQNIPPTGALKGAPKAPIPTEHQILQTQFDELIKKAMNQNNNQQIKRKLDECSRRIEFLYDKLRGNSLSPNIIGGLHQVAQSVASRDYAGGLRHHTHIVTHSNFSEISAFMPGLKSLLQIAGQLRI
uniref:Protein transport protein Sec31A n=1 Tax=Ciona savignyi TaxID=51511 RepID=H2ZFZ5_CIOSA